MYRESKSPIGDMPATLRGAVNGYRFSIIPAAAVTDRRLEGRDLQVLCLIGRHTDRNGWCRRSQVKMAAELGCGRATVQRALERLYTSGYLQRRLEGTRYGEAPAEGDQPFRAHSYRVLMDRDDAAECMAEIAGVPAGEHVGVPAYGQGVPAIDGHGVPTHTRAPIEGPSIKRTPLNSEASGDENGSGKEPFSETGHGSKPVISSADAPIGAAPSARAQQDTGAGSCSTANFAEFQAAWGTSAIDNVSRTMRAWGKLTIEQRQAALAGIKPFKAELERAKRTHLIAGWRYIEERRWEILSVTTVDWIDVKPLSRDWWALLFDKIDRGEKFAFFVQHSLANSNPIPQKRDAMPGLDKIARLEAYPSDGEVAQTWRPWLDAHGIRLPSRDRLWVFLPSVSPPSSGSVWKTSRSAA